MSSSYVKPLKSVLKDKRVLLEGFGIRVTKQVLEHIESLYPNEIAIENYTRSLVSSRLDRFN